MSIHSSISPDECEYSFEDAARPWIDLGYPVIPIVEKRRARKGLVASTDREQIQRWGRAFPGANPGVVLKDLPVLVLDVDGQAGEKALAGLLATAGCSLPATFEEATGREGGRHIFLRLPIGAEPSVTQYGGTLGSSPGLDVLVNGHVVVAGARHKSGRLYSTLGPMMPPSQLAEIPSPLCQLLASRAGRRDVRAVELRAKHMKQTPSGRIPPARVAALLDDQSDGRDKRAFVAVSLLVERSWSDEDIVNAVLDSPLGAKARKANPRDPAAWVVHKIHSLRQQEPFDRGACWAAAHTGGLGSARLRVLDFLLGLAGHTSGVVGIGYTKIGLGSAMDQAGPIVKSLVAEGWLTVVKVADIAAGRPTLYRLTVPRTTGTDGEAPQRPAGQEHEPHRPSLPLPPPPDEELSVWFMTCTTGHDAFRRASGTLSPAYPLFALLRRQATDLDDLARWLGRPHKTVQRHAKLLVQAGVASWCPEGLQLVPGQPQAALTAVARGAGTDGTRVRAYRKYLQACDEWAASRAEWLSEYVVGSDAWIAYTFKETLEVFRSPTCSALRDVACQKGDRLLEDVAMDVVIAEAERHRRRGPLSNHGHPSIVAPTHGMDH